MPFEPHLRLFRPANVWTAFADVAAGSAVALSAWPAGGTFVLALGASGCFYASGMAFNDIFDVERDRTLHPDRPLPTGAVSRRLAVVLAGALMAVGIGLAFAAGWRTGCVGLVLATLVLVYDGLLSHTAAGPLVMGGCRTANVLLGVTLAGTIGQPGLAAAGLVGLYTIGISLAARQERSPRRAALIAAWLPTLLAASGTIVLAVAPGKAVLLAVPFLLLVVFWTGWCLVAAVKALNTPAVVRLVKASILALPVLDAAFVAAFHDWRLALPVAALAVPAWLMSRWFKMT